MATSSWATIRAYIRTRMQDVNTAFYGLSDDRVLELYNKNYVAWRDAMGTPETRRVAAVDLGSGLTAGAIAQGDRVINYANANTYREILRLYREESDSVICTGVELVRSEPHLIKRLQDEESDQAAPTKYALQLQDNNPVTLSGALLWAVWLHPIPDATYYLSGIVKAVAAKITTTTQIPAVSENEAFQLADATAAQGAVLLRRNFADDLWRSVPEQMQSVLGYGQSITSRPKPKPEEQPA